VIHGDVGLGEAGIGEGADDHGELVGLVVEGVPERRAAVRAEAEGDVPAVVTLAGELRGASRNLDLRALESRVVAERAAGTPLTGEAVADGDG
jgi:hypothetical protein